MISTIVTRRQAGHFDHPSRRKRAWFGGLTLACMLCSAVAEAQTEGEPTRLEWIRLEGAESCPTRAIFEQAVRSRMGSSPFSANAKRSLTIELSSESGPFRAVLILRQGGEGGVDSRQELFSYSTACDELFGATVLSVSLLLSPRADEDEPLPEESEVEAPLPTETPGQRPPPTRKSPEPPAPEPRVEAVPLPRAPQPWLRKGARASAALAVGLDRVPKTSLGLAVRAEFPVAAQWFVGLEGSWLHAQQGARLNSGAQLGAGLSAAWLDVGWLMSPAGPLELALEVGAGFEVLHVNTRPQGDLGGDDGRFAGRVGLGLNLRLDPRVTLCSSYFAILVPKQTAYLSGTDLLWEPTWLGGQFYFGLAIDFL